MIADSASNQDGILVRVILPDDAGFSELWSAFFHERSDATVAEFERRFIDGSARGYQLAIAYDGACAVGAVGYSVTADVIRGRYVVIQHCDVRPSADRASVTRALESHVREIGELHECSVGAIRIGNA